MPERRPLQAPLASYVLRVSGRPAVLRYELLDVRTGERHRFTRAEALADFLRRQGLEPESILTAAPPSGGEQGPR